MKIWFEYKSKNTNKQLNFVYLYISLKTDK